MHNVRIAKTHTVEVNDSKFSSEVKDFIFAYGLKQLLSDAGSSGKDADEKLTMANKKLAALYEGTLRTAREGKPGASQAETLAARFAMSDLKTAIIKSGKKIKQFTEEQIDALVLKVLASKPEHYAKLATDEIERLARVATEAETIDLAELDL